MVTERVIARLSVYRRLLTRLANEGTDNIFSHDLATLAGLTAAQVRRDLMTIGYSGSPARGYHVTGLIEKIGEYLDRPDGQAVILVGVGHLGQAIIAYFNHRSRGLNIVAAFDADETKINRVIHGCRCHPMDQLNMVVHETQADVAVLAVPGTEAQKVAEELVRQGIRGLLNFAPVRLHMPANVFVENVDISVSIEKVAFFARQESLKRN